MKHVWNYEQLMKNKNEIQNSSIHHIVDDRLQEETVVTDSITSIPHQRVSKSVINIVLIIIIVLIVPGDTEINGKEDI